MKQRIFLLLLSMVTEFVAGSEKLTKPAADPSSYTSINPLAPLATGSLAVEPNKPKVLSARYPSFEKNKPKGPNTKRATFPPTAKHTVVKAKPTECIDHDWDGFLDGKPKPCPLCGGASAQTSASTSATTSAAASPASTTSTVSTVATQFQPTITDEELAFALGQANLSSPDDGAEEVTIKGIAVVIETGKKPASQLTKEEERLIESMLGAAGVQEAEDGDDTLSGVILELDK